MIELRRDEDGALGEVVAAGVWADLHVAIADGYADVWVVAHEGGLEPALGLTTDGLRTMADALRELADVLEAYE